MQKKVIITERQLKVILDNIKPKSVTINEGLKDMVLGTALLMGIKLSGQNKIIGDKALANPKVLNKIKDNLETEKINDLAEALESVGYTNALNRLEQDSQTIQKNFDDIAFKLNGVTGGLRVYIKDEH